MGLFLFELSSSINNARWLVSWRLLNQLINELTNEQIKQIKQIIKLSN